MGVDPSNRPWVRYICHKKDRTIRQRNWRMIVTSIHFLFNIWTGTVLEKDTFLSNIMYMTMTVATDKQIVFSVVQKHSEMCIYFQLESGKSATIPYIMPRWVTVNGWYLVHPIRVFKAGSALNNNSAKRLAEICRLQCLWKKLSKLVHSGVVVTAKTVKEREPACLLRLVRIFTPLGL